MRFDHTTDIAAPPEAVWHLTTDVERWPDLMDTVTSAQRLDDRPLQPGCTVRLRQPFQRPTVWTVTTVAAPRTFVWRAQVFGVTTVASHLIEPTPTGCRNTLVLELSGRGASLMGRLLGGRLRATLAAENDAFRRAAEATVAA